jgi:hypothetical protein
MDRLRNQMTRYILRPPSIGSTPKRLKRWLKADGVKKVQPGAELMADWEKDFFMAYPPLESVVNPPPNYLEMRALYVSDKLRQRQWLSNQGLPVPGTFTRLGQAFGNPVPGGDWGYVVRPLRHRGGAEYRVAGHSSDCDPEHEYISEVFPKRWEYRIILVKGKPLVTLLKKTIRSIAFNQPWNHANGTYFVTCHSYASNRLRWTDVYDRLEQSPVLKQFHIVGLDVMLGDRHALGLPRHPYAICEMNFCPSLTIQNNLEALRTHVLHGT